MFQNFIKAFLINNALCLCFKLNQTCEQRKYTQLSIKNKTALFVIGIYKKSISPLDEAMAS